MSTMFDPALVQWETELEQRIRSNEGRIVAEQGKAAYEKMLQRAIRVGEGRSEGYRYFQELVSQIEDTDSPRQYLGQLNQARKATLEYVPEDLRQQLDRRLSSEIRDVLQAGMAYTQAFRQFESAYGDPDSALAEYRAKGEEITEPVRTALERMNSFPGFWKELEPLVRQARAKDPDASIEQVARNTTLFDALNEMGASASGALVARLELGTDQDQIATHQLQKMAEKASPKDRKILADNSEEFKKLALGRTRYLELLRDRDAMASQMAKEDGIPFRDAKAALQMALLESYKNLRKLHDGLPRLEKDEFFVPAAPRAGGGGTTDPAFILRQALRGGEKLTRGLREAVLSPESELEIRGAVGAYAPSGVSTEGLNVQTILDELTVLGLLGPQFALGRGTLGRGAAALAKRLGAGKVLQSVALGAGTGAAEALTPEKVEGGVKGRAIRGGLAAGAGGVLEGVGTAIAKGIKKLRPGAKGVPATKVREVPPQTAEPAEATTLRELDEGVSSVVKPVSGKTPEERLLNLVKEAKPIRAATTRLQRQERGRRIKEFTKALRQGDGGEESFYRALKTQKGKLPQAEFESLRPRISQEDVNYFFRTMSQSGKLDEFEKLRAGDALRTLFSPEGGRVPQPAQLELLARVFGGDFVRNILKNRKLIKPEMQLLAEVVGLPRAALATADMSAFLRQGVPIIARHPKIAAKNFTDMFRYAFSPQAYEALGDEIVARTTYQKMRQAGLSLTALDKGPGLTGREEVFMSHLAEKLPLGLGKVQRFSNRAHTGFLTKLRADVFDDTLRRLEKANLKNLKKGKAPKIDLNDEDNLRALGKFINAASGRGSLGELEAATPVLAQAFFSPRLIASRLQMLNYLNPIKYARATGAGRIAQKEALKSMFATFGAGMTLLQLAKAGGAEVGDDITSADFGKIKIGDTRIDIWAGFQQYFVLLGRWMKGYRTSSVSGNSRELGPGYSEQTRSDLGLEFLGGKRNPGVTFAKMIFDGYKNGQITDPRSGQEVELSRLVEDTFTPIMVQDLMGIMETDPELIWTVAPAFFGVGVSTYPSPREGESRIIKPAIEAVAL